MYISKFVTILIFVNLYTHKPALPLLQAAAISWFSTAQDGEITLSWSPLEDVHGNKHSAYIIKTRVSPHGEKKVYRFPIPSTQFNRLLLNKNPNGDFALRLQNKRNEYEQSTCKSIFYKATLLSLDALWMTYQGAQSHPEEFKEFFDHVEDAQRKIEGKERREYKKQFPKKSIFSVIRIMVPDKKEIDKLNYAN